jgi:hypothetical protein
MSCVARDLRRESRDALRARTPLDRIRLALELGRADAERYAQAHGTTVEMARQVFQRQRQSGRRQSSAHDALLA